MFTEDQKLVLAAFSLLRVQGLDPTIHKKLDSLAVWISKDVAKMTLIGRGGGGVEAENCQRHGRSTKDWVWSLMAHTTNSSMRFSLVKGTYDLYDVYLKACKWLGSARYKPL